MFACASISLTVIVFMQELLLMHGADVKLQGNRGWSALHHLAYRGDARGCSLLFKVRLVVFHEARWLRPPLPL